MTGHAATPLLWESDGPVCTLTLNRPSRKNAFDYALYDALSAALERAAADERILVVVLTGAGDYFSSGADLKATDMPETPAARAPVGRFMQTVMQFPKILVAAVNGPAVGIGTTLLPHCDMSFASETATFWAPFSRIAVVPEFCSSILFYEMMGPSLGTEVILGGRKLTAQEGLRAGLVSRVLPPSEFRAKVQEQVRALVDLPLAAKTLPLFKRMIRAPHREKLQRAFAEEMTELDERLRNGDTAEAVVSLMQRRARL